MRLINTSTLEVEDFPNHVPRYAILSHRWREEEVTFKDVELQRHRSLLAFDKIEQCCRLAASRSFSYLWVDTCCIDKSSSAELNEAINSMFRWYQDSGECYVYLHDVDAELVNTNAETTKRAIRASIIFSRGWTLQELIAPERVYFFNTNWTKLGSKSRTSLGPLLEQITGIDIELLCHRKTLSQFCIGQRLSWAALRHTSRIEDEAYCLLGILEVHMPMLYGEGKHAFRRLQEEVIKQSDDQTIFAWHDCRERKSILAPSPSCFRELQNAICVYATSDDRTGYTLGNSGLSIQAMLIPWSMNVFLLPLGCGYLRNSDQRASIRGYNRICILVRKTEHPGLLVRVALNGLDVIDMDSDHIAAIRDDMRIETQRVILRQNVGKIVTPLLYHGFHVKYAGAKIFPTGRSPRLCDVICYHDYALDEGILTSNPLGLHATGAIRLICNGNLNRRSLGDSKLMMYFGFDLDFAPVCLISSATPRIKSDLWHDDLSKLSSDDKMTVLHLPWLLDRIKEGNTDTNLLAFRGSPDRSATVTCRTTSLKLHFSLKPWKGGSRIWTVSLEDWQAPISTALSPAARSALQKYFASFEVRMTSQSRITLV